MRKRVDWLKVLHKLDNPDIDKLYFRQLSILRRGKHFSSRRCAYYALKVYYSTTTIDQLLNKIEFELRKLDFWQHSDDSILLPLW